MEPRNGYFRFGKSVVTPPLVRAECLRSPSSSSSLPWGLDVGCRDPGSSPASFAKPLPSPQIFHRKSVISNGDLESSEHQF